MRHIYPYSQIKHFEIMKTLHFTYFGSIRPEEFIKIAIRKFARIS